MMVTFCPSYELAPRMKEATLEVANLTTMKSITNVQTQTVIIKETDTTLE